MPDTLGLKALILAAGKGSRLGSLTSSQSKCMIPIHGKPLITFSLDIARHMEVDEIIIVVGHHAQSIISWFGNQYHGTHIHYVIQPKQAGLVNAIECAIPKIGNADFILMLGDEFFVKPHHQQFLLEFKKEKDLALCGVVCVKDKEHIKKTYAAQLKKGSRRILQLIEKPSTLPNNLMGTGNVLFRNKILSYIPKTPVNPQRGEKELADLINLAISSKESVSYFEIAEKYINLNTLEDLEAMEKLS